MAEVYDIKTRRRRPISLSDYEDMLNTLVKYLPKDRYPRTLSIIKEVRWAAKFSHRFREQTRTELREILDDVYLMVNDP
jgi:hypothetical protein